MNIQKKLSKRNTIIFSTILMILMATGAVIYFNRSEIADASNLASSAAIEPSDDSTSLFEMEVTLQSPTIKYGFILDNYEVTHSTIKKNEVLSTILARHQVAYPTIDRLVSTSKDVYDVRKLNVGKSYTILSPKAANKGKEAGAAAQYFIYEPDVFKYVIYNLQDTTSATVVYRAVDTLVQASSGIVHSNLWNAMMDNQLDYELAVRMEDALGYMIDFHHIQQQDKFKLIYDELLIDNETVGVGGLAAAYFEHRGKPYYAFYYKDDRYDGYFDENGRPMKKAFLKSPVKYTRISSPFNLRRFHPVLRRVKAHLGTDYAAPRGTPIYAVASGKVTRSGYTRGNGNFVKIKHDNTYSTQYLHMSKIASTARVGMQVKQGDVIGYVGSTGLATGPHVCFRFWKNGKQVDHRKEDLPEPKPMEQESLMEFKKVVERYKKELDAIQYKSNEDA